MSISINDINTVDDLLKAQSVEEDVTDTTDAADTITKQLLDEDPSVGIDVACRVLYALREFHANGVELYIKECKAEYSAQWAADHAKLDLALDLIKDIQLQFSVINTFTLSFFNMALSPAHLLSAQDMEDFAQDYLGLSGIDADMYYESYYQLNDNGEQYDDEEYERSQDEMTQTRWEY